MNYTMSLQKIFSKNQTLISPNHFLFGFGNPYLHLSDPTCFVILKCFFLLYVSIHTNNRKKQEKKPFVLKKKARSQVQICKHSISNVCRICKNNRWLIWSFQSQFLVIYKNNLNQFQLLTLRSTSNLICFCLTFFNAGKKNKKNKKFEVEKHLSQRL